MMIKYYENYYADDFGRLFKLKNGEYVSLKPYVSKKGYLMYRYRTRGQTKHVSAHHLSYYTHVSKFDTSDGLQIDHIDGDKMNNHYSNLRRVTARQNINNSVTKTKLYGREPTNKLNLDPRKIDSMIREGLSYKEIAIEMGCSRRSVNNYHKMLVG